MDRLIRVAILSLVTLIFVSFISSIAYSVTPAKGGVAFLNLKDGQEVTSPFPVHMQVTGKSVAQAGDPAPNTGHFHIIIDGSFIEEGKVVPADGTHIHYGKAQTSTELSLAPGNHTLTLQFADTNHISFGKTWATTIKIVVLEKSEIESVQISED